MVPRENLEESVVRTGRDFPPLGEIPVFRRDLPVSMPYNLLFSNLDYSRVEVAADARHRV